MPIKSVVNTSPSDIGGGDVFIVTVAFHVMFDGSIRIYRCPYPDPEISEDGVPQGDGVLEEYTDVLCQALVPVLSW